MPATLQREETPGRIELPVKDQIAALEAKLRALRQRAGRRVILP